MFKITIILSALLASCLLGCLSSNDSVTVRYITATPDGTQIAFGGSDEGAAVLPPLSVNHQTAQLTPSPVLVRPIQTACIQQENVRPNYTVEASLNWAEHLLRAEQQITYTNTTGTLLDNLVLHVEANRNGGFFTLGEVILEDGRRLENTQLELTRLTIPLPEPLAVGCQIILNLTYQLKIPPVIGGYEGRFGYLGFTERQINLGHWMPMVARHTMDEWQVPRPHVVGEQISSEASDFEVRLSISDAPPTIDVAGPGQVQVVGGNQWQFKLSGGRDLSISVGNGFRRTSQLADDGTIIELYYFPNSAPQGLNPAGQALQAASEALVLYAELFGVPYPFKRLVIVEGDFPDGMEFSGLVFVGEAWFRTWRGQPNDWITVITVHEVAHQWWYALVGNDPTTHPYLDEAFATYSEYLYFQRYHGDLTEWWWNFRVRSYDTTQNPVDTDIYLYNDARPYINAVYLHGAEMLHTMRTDLGDEAFFTWLKKYVLHYEYTVATPEDLWSQLSPEEYAESLPIRQRFFARWGILPEQATPIPTPTLAG
jgi:hypothetical protein